MDKKQFKHKKENTDSEQNEGKATMMMLSVSMIKGVAADAKSQNNHGHLEIHVMNNVNPK
jgi:hypothetical protein